MKRTIFRVGMGLVCAAVMLGARAADARVPAQFTVQGVVRDGMGKLQTAMVSVSVTLYDAQAGGSPIAGPYGPMMAAATNGLFTVPVGDPQLRVRIAAAPAVWLELAVDGERYARQQVTAQLYALAAAGAETADALSVACVGCVSDAMIGTVAGSKVFGKVPTCGNADTVTNGVYTNQMYMNPPFIASLDGAKITGAVASATNATNATNATQLGGLDNTKFMRTDTNTQTAGSLTVAGNIQVNGIVRGGTYGFGGTYEYSCTGIGLNCGCAAGQAAFAALINNPFTGAQSCPAGFSASPNYFWNGTTVYCQIFCVK